MIQEYSGFEKASPWLIAAVLVLLFLFSIVPASAAPLDQNRHIFINVSNDAGIKYDLDGGVYGTGNNGTYYIKADGGGLNELHITADTSADHGQVTTSNDQSGVFYVSNTGGRGFDDDIVLLLAVNGTVPDDFAVHIKTSGYTWTPSSVANQHPTNYTYVDGAVDETFTKEDFLYGPQTWKPGPGAIGNVGLPLYEGQDVTDTNNTFSLMFIDLHIGNIEPSKFSGATFTDNGDAKVEYSFENLETFAAFNGYGWCRAAFQDQGISWTNQVSGQRASGYSVVGIPPVLTSINVTPATAEVKTGTSMQFTAAALDQNDRPMNGIAVAWSSSNETVGTVNETGYFTALAEGTTTLTAANGTFEGKATVTVTAAPPGPQPLPDYNHIFFNVANDAGVKYNVYGNNTYNVRFARYDSGLNALHISTDPAENFGQVTVSENQSGTFYATDSGGKHYEDEIILMVAVNGTVPDDFRLHVNADGYTWTPNPVNNTAPPLDTVTYQPVALNETFTKEDFRYGPQIWKPTGNGFDYPIYYGQNMNDTGNTFQLMFIDLNAGVLAPNADLENRGAVRINYSFENLDSFAAFGVYGYSQNTNKGDYLVAWGNALLPGTTGRVTNGYSVIGAGSGPVPSRIEVFPATAALAVGDDQQFTATAYDASDAEIASITPVWSSSNETVGTVDATGAFTALAAGTTTVSAAYGAVTGQAAVTVQAATPQTWYVDDDGSADFTTIQAAVDAAADGDTIIVRDGIYSENVDVTKSLVIRSENGTSVTTLQSAARDSAFDVTAGAVTIDGFTIAGVTGSGNYGIYVHGADGALITNNTVQNCRECIKIESSSGNTVTRNILSVRNNVANNVFWLADASNNLVYLNSFNLGAVTIEGSSEGNVFTSPTEMQYAFNGADYQSYVGNYWNGYSGSDADGNGIGDEAYTIAGNVTDAYPLSQTLDTYTIDGPVAEGTTYYVDGDGSADFTTIQAAVDAAADGDTIIVRDGTYTENVDVTKSLVIRSENGSSVTTLHSAARDSGFDVTAGAVTIDGFTIAGVSGRGNYGIYVHGADGALIANNTVQNCRECIKIESSSGNTLTRNIFSLNNVANNVFWLANASTNLIYLNDFSLGVVTVEGTSSDNSWSSPLAVKYAFDGSIHTSTLGNHWNSYSGSDTTGDGVGEEPYTLAIDNVDAYPLVNSQADYLSGDLPEGISIQVTPSNPAIPASETVAFTAVAYDNTGAPIEGAAFTWSSGNTTVGTIDPDGVCSALVPGITTITASYAGASGSTNLTVGRTRYVDDDGGADFTTIQAALDAAFDGDAIIVRDGMYNETLTIAKPLTLKSANGPEKTKIVSTSKYGITVSADGTTISGFSINGSGKYGIYSDGYSGCTFVDNAISEKSNGMQFKKGSGLRIEGNSFTSGNGVYLLGTTDSIIVNNTFSVGDCGIKLVSGSTNNIVTGNTITGYNFAFALLSSSRIDHNLVMDNGCISFGGSNTIFDNIIYANSFVNNTRQFGTALRARNTWNSTVPVTYTYNGTTYTSLIGNYWGATYPIADVDGNGIADAGVSMPISLLDPCFDNVDNYPLVLPAEAYSGESYAGIPIPTTLEVSPSSAVMPGETTQQYTGTVYDQNGKIMTGTGFAWSSSDETVGSVRKGLFTADHAGTTTITARCYLLKDTAEAVVNKTILETVWTDPCESTDGWTLSHAGLQDIPQYVYNGSYSIGTPAFEGDASAERTVVFPDGAAQIRFRAFGDRGPSGGGVYSWIEAFIDNESVATIPQRSTWKTHAINITGYETGEHTFKIESHFDAGGRSGRSLGFYVDQIEVRIDPAVITPDVSSITIAPASVNLTAGATQTFVATAYDVNGTAMPGVSFTWTSSNTTVGTVDATGTFIAHKIGTTTVSAAANGAVGTATVTVTPPHGDQTQDSSLNVPGCNLTTKGDGKEEVRINTTATNATVSGNTILIEEGTFSLNIRTEGAPTVVNGTVNGTVAGITLNTTPVTTTFDDLGTVSASLEANLTGIPSGAALQTTVSANVSADAQSAFQLAASKDGLNLDAVAYTMNIKKTKLANGQDVSNATIRMAVSQAWVDAHGGVNEVRIIRSAEDGTKEVLTTEQVGTDADGNLVFEAYSPNGLSLFGLAATSTTPSGTTSSSSHSSSGGGSSEIAAISGSIPAGETQSFAVTETAVTKITVDAYDTIDDMLVTVQKASLPKNMTAPTQTTFQVIETTLYRVDPSAIDGVTLEFAVPTSWLESHGLATDNIVLLGYERNGWKPLKTTFLKEENEQALYSAEASGFSYFAIVAGTTTAAGQQVTETVTPVTTLTETAATTSPTTTPTTQQSPLPWFVAVVALGTLFLIGRRE